MESQISSENRTGKIPKLIEAIGIFVLFAAICYAILIFVSGHLVVPVFVDNFNRSVIFLTAVLAVIYYKEELEEILLLCFGGPFITNILAIIPAILIWSESPSSQVWTDVMRYITFTCIYTVFAGFVGFVIYIVAVWIAGFMSSLSPSPSAFSKKNVFSVIDKKMDITDAINTTENTNNAPHTKNQVIGFLIFVVILLNLTILLFLLPFYSYSSELYLTIWDLGLLPVILVSLVIIDLSSIILVIAVWYLHPPLMEKYPSMMIGIQSKLAVISIFFSSLFFPNPSSIRVDTFVVENSIGIEILFYAIILIIIFTPSICEYLQPIKSKYIS